MDEQTYKLQQQAIAGGSKQFQNSRRANIGPPPLLKAGDRVMLSVLCEVKDGQTEGYDHVRVEAVAGEHFSIWCRVDKCIKVNS